MESLNSNLLNFAVKMTFYHCSWGGVSKFTPTKTERQTERERQTDRQTDEHPHPYFGANTDFIHC